MIGREHTDCIGGDLIDARVLVRVSFCEGRGEVRTMMVLVTDAMTSGGGADMAESDRGS
jgi:hypothetical protein